MRKKYNNSVIFSTRIPANGIEEIAKMIEKHFEYDLIVAYKVYISGAISGVEYSTCKEKFEKSELEIRKLKVKEGYKPIPINPLELLHSRDKSWKSYLREDLKWLKKCDAIYMQKDWRDSRGATLELWFAKRYNKVVYFEI